MEITISSNLITILKDDGSEVIINGQQITSDSDVRGVEFNTEPVVQGSDPYTIPTPTSVARYKVFIHLSDQRTEWFYVDEVTNQPGWTNDVAGANQAVADIAVAMLIGAGIPGSGTVTNLTFTDGNGFNGTIASPSTTPAISLTTTVADTQVVFSDSGAVVGSAGLTYDSTLGSLTISEQGGGSALLVVGTDAIGEITSAAPAGLTIGATVGPISLSSADVTIISSASRVSIQVGVTERLGIEFAGDWLIGGSPGTAGQVLTSSGPGASPGWGGPMVYRAYVTQSGTDAPVASIGANTIGSIVWTRGASKEAIGTLVGAFPAGITTIQVTTGLVTGEIVFPTSATRNDDNTVVFSMTNITDGNSEDGWEANVTITIG